jgi:hypothetical protein
MASRDFSAASVAWARLCWKRPRAALNTRRKAMIAASTYLPSASSSTITTSSIHGTVAQNIPSAMRNGCACVRHRVGANLASRRRASSPVKPYFETTLAAVSEVAGATPVAGEDARVSVFLAPANPACRLSRREWEPGASFVCASVTGAASGAVGDQTQDCRQGGAVERHGRID